MLREKKKYVKVNTFQSIPNGGEWKQTISFTDTYIHKSTYNLLKINEKSSKVKLMFEYLSPMEEAAAAATAAAAAVEIVALYHNV